MLKALALFLIFQVFADVEMDVANPVHDYEPCDDNHGGCSLDAFCHFADDEVHCICHAGFHGDGKTCLKISSCKMNHGGCDPNAICEVGHLGPKCTCKEGFEGDGRECVENTKDKHKRVFTRKTPVVPVNPCLVNNGWCHPYAKCNWVDRLVICICQKGFRGDGRDKCEKIGVCEHNNGGCDENALCEVGNVGPKCTCKKGFVGNGKDCKDVKEIFTQIEEIAYCINCLYLKAVGDPKYDEYCWKDHNKKIHCAKYVKEVDVGDEPMPMPEDRFWVDDGCHTEKGNKKNKFMKDDFKGAYHHPKTFKAGVRCCHDNGKCTSPKKCPADYSLEKAGKICASEGGRLCTKEELLSEICCGTGGRCNHYAVWTSTREPNPCLNNNGGCSANAMCHNNYGTTQCTCKAGYFGSGTTCEKILFWVDDGCHTESGKSKKQKGKNKYVKDDFEGSFKDPEHFKAGVRCCHTDGTCTSPTKCPGDYTLKQAEDICVKDGGQVCTKKQLMSEICCGTGGQCNHYPVWTTTSNNEPVEAEDALAHLMDSDSHLYFAFLGLICVVAFGSGYYLSNRNRKNRELAMELTDYATLSH